MILPDLVLPTRVSQRWQYSGIDSLEHCLDKKHFLEYPYPVDYQYNSRGFRDEEWPDSLEELQEAVWCVGDSFTVGVGQPFDHIWPQMLSHRMQTRTINISMDGASNDWICRRAIQIQTEIAPRLMIVMWSYTHRREHANHTWSDEKRILFSSHASSEQDLQHWLNLALRLRNHDVNIIECTVPSFHPPADLYIYQFTPLEIIKQDWERLKSSTWPLCPENLAELDALPDDVISELKDLHGCYEYLRSKLSESDEPGSRFLDDVICVVNQLDWARDHHHFDILTSRWLVDRILQRMITLDSSRSDLLLGSEH